MCCWLFLSFLQTKTDKLGFYLCHRHCCGGGAGAYFTVDGIERVVLYLSLIIWCTSRQTRYQCPEIVFSAFFVLVMLWRNV